MTAISTRALVVGGGPAGLSAAGMLAQAGIDTVCVSPVVPPDARTVAVMEPSLRMLRSLDAFTDHLRAVSAPLKQLHMVDDTGNMVSAPTLRFSASECDLEAFGWNVPMSDLVPQLRLRCEALGVRFVEGRLASAICGETGIAATLEDGSTINASFAFAADGRLSVLRKSAAIDVRSWSFDQSALVTRFKHSRSHEFVSTEWHKLGGPFTTVPLPGNSSALVWLDKPDKVAARAALSSEDLAREIQLQNHGSLGLISEVSPPHVYPMHGLTAARFAARRVFLIGEAAHVFPPVGAQGLNMSFRDAGHAVDVVLSHDDPGGEQAMEKYHALRQPDVLPRQAAVSAMNTSLLSDVEGLHVMRAAGLAAISMLPPLRKLVLQQGLAASSGLPFAMRG